MPKVCFAISVKYNGVNYAPNTPFEALEHDVKALCAMGGWRIKEPKVTETGVNEPEVEQSEMKEHKAGQAKEKPARTRRSKTKEV